MVSPVTGTTPYRRETVGRIGHLVFGHLASNRVSRTAASGFGRREVTAVLGGRAISVLPSFFLALAHRHVRAGRQPRAERLPELPQDAERLPEPPLDVEGLPELPADAGPVGVRQHETLPVGRALLAPAARASPQAA